MVHLEFEFRQSTQEEILLFSEEFSNECRLNPEIRFFTIYVQDESYVIFAIKFNVENDKSSYKDTEGNVYYLECEPDDEFYYMFAKIEYGDTIEYYDRCSPDRKTRYARRFINL